MTQDRIQLLASDLWNYVFATLDAEPTLHFGGPDEAIACYWDNQFYLLMPLREQ